MLQGILAVLCGVLTILFLEGSYFWECVALLMARAKPEVPIQKEIRMKHISRTVTEPDGTQAFNSWHRESHLDYTKMLEDDLIRFSPDQHHQFMFAPIPLNKVYSKLLREESIKHYTVQ